MDQARIAELLQPFIEDDTLTADDLARISIYIDLLMRWNARINLTAIRAPEQIVRRHFGESLFTARQLFPTRADHEKLTLADIGSGAGFPGIPIRVWAPQLDLTLIESNHKKATFLREVARALTLTDINIKNARVETLQKEFTVVTFRAVERFHTVLPIAARLVAPMGRLALLIGVTQAASALALLSGFEATTPYPIPLSSSRTLLICRRTEEVRSGGR